MSGVCEEHEKLLNDIADIKEIVTRIDFSLHGVNGIPGMVRRIENMEGYQSDWMILGSVINFTGKVLPILGTAAIIGLAAWLFELYRTVN